ncbi:hypothetical protein [Longispora albida]|uniref:hypothetical protein n=1 Tax=Longispora albida TaxID=203523 RepID=UPI00037F85EE|nr:hypothetical protein [Longispora albida]
MDTENPATSEYDRPGLAQERAAEYLADIEKGWQADASQLRQLAEAVRDSHRKAHWHYIAAVRDMAEKAVSESRHRFLCGYLAELEAMPVPWEPGPGRARGVATVSTALAGGDVRLTAA